MTCPSSRLHVFISDGVAVGLGLLEVTVKIDAGYLLCSLLACACSVTVKTADLAEKSRARCLSALNEVGAMVPVQAPRIESWMHVIVSRVSR